MFSDADAFEFQSPVVIGYRDQAEIGGSAANITDEDDVTGADQGTPLSTCLLDPGVECCLGLFQQGDFAETRGLRGISG